MKGAARQRFEARRCANYFSATRFRRRRPTSTSISCKTRTTQLYKTARDRLTAHRDNPTCAGCHAVMDPIGLGIENYDGIGQYRTHENGAVIDSSGEFENKSYRNLIELQRILRDNPSTTNCVAERVFAYGVGRKSGANERQWLTYLRKQFADDRYAFASLMRTVATSQAFRAVNKTSPAS